MIDVSQGAMTPNTSPRHAPIYTPRSNDNKHVGDSLESVDSVTPVPFTGGAMQLTQPNQPDGEDQTPDEDLYAASPQVKAFHLDDQGKISQPKPLQQADKPVELMTRAEVGTSAPVTALDNLLVNGAQARSASSTANTNCLFTPQD